MEDKNVYSKLLISKPGFYRHFTSRDISLWIYDRSSIPFLIEEFVAHAAVEIAIPENSLAAQVVAELSPILQDRVRIVDRDGASRKLVNHILAPVYEEFEMVVEERSHHPHIAKQSRDETQFPIVRAVVALHEELYDFILGTHLQLQVGLDFIRLKSAIQFLRRHTRGKDARACLAVLQGVTATYRPLSVSSATLKPAANDDQMYHFRTFVEDQTYRDLSRNTSQLGIPNRVQRATELMARGVRKLTMQPIVKNIISLGRTGMSVATDVPLPETEVVERLIPNGYFPPIISLDELYDRAHQEWRNTRANLHETLEDIKLDTKNRDLFLAAEKSFGEPWKESTKAVQPPRNTRESIFIMTSAPVLDNEDDAFLRLLSDGQGQTNT